MDTDRARNDPERKRAAVSLGALLGYGPNLHEGDERGFIAAVRARGFKEGSPEFREILELFWAETRQPSKPPRGKP
jgi:hypothetical protein